MPEGSEPKRRLDYEDLAKVLDEGDAKNKAWKKSLPPPLTDEQTKEAIAASKAHNQEVKEVVMKIYRAQKKYADMYEDDPRTWQILTFEERVKEVIKRLAQDGTTLNEVERVQVVTALKASTKKIFFTEELVDAHDGPGNPARIAKATAKKYPPDFQKAE